MPQAVLTNLVYPVLFMCLSCYLQADTGIGGTGLRVDAPESGRLGNAEQAALGKEEPASGKVLTNIVPVH